MKNITNRFVCLISLTVLLFGMTAAFAFSTNSPSNQYVAGSSTLISKSQDEGLDPKILKLALNAYSHAESLGMDKKGIVTIVDYSEPSSSPRLWVINVKNGDILFHTYVAHGKGSGDKFSTQFSDRFGTDASSIGVYLTGNSYMGKHGFSMKVHGLDKGYNDNAFARAIVMHSAWYVSPTFLKQNGRLGRSWGCFALDTTVCRQIISTIKGGTIMLAYYPNKQWIASSKFLNG